MISHDWHVQPSCQRPNRGPPERRAFSPGENARKHFRLSSKLYNHTVRRKSRQSSLPTEFPDDFHIGKYSVEERRRESKARYSAQQYGLPFGVKRHFQRRTLCCSPDGRQKIEKRSLLLGGPCFEGTLRNVFSKTCFAFRIESRGRDD